MLMLQVSIICYSVFKNTVRINSIKESFTKNYALLIRITNVRTKPR